MNRLSRLLSVATLIVALALAACGSGDKGDPAADFKRGYTAESVKLKAIGDDLSTAIGSATKMTDSQVTTTFGALAARAQASAARLRDLEPTDEAKSTLGTLENALERAAGDLRAISTAARTHDPKAAKTAAAALITASLPIRDARADLDKLVGRTTSTAPKQP